MSHRFAARAGRVVAALFVAATGACQSTAAPRTPIQLEARPLPVTTMPALGTDSTLDVATWNLEWFGDPERGPGDEALQLENVRALIDALQLDLWSVQEVTGEAHFTTLLDALHDYDGLLANDPRVIDGPEFYNDFGGNELKVGLIYRTGAVTVDSARVILGEYDYSFAGRPPVELHLTVAEAGREPLDLVAILIHAKAGASEPDRERRAAGANALKDYLDAEHPDRRVLVIGDFNDDVDTSIVQGRTTPYAPFVADTARYLFPTAGISIAGGTSTVFYDDVIDHHLASDETAEDYVPGTALAFPAQRYLEEYGETTSDHYPILARYAPWTAGGPDMTATGPQRQVELEWSGAGDARLYIFRNGARIVMVEGDGSWVDTVPPEGGGTFVYRLCETGLERCSDDATVTF